MIIIQLKKYYLLIKEPAKLTYYPLGKALEEQN